MYSGTADWTLIGEVKNNQRMHIPIIGNGDITGTESAVKARDIYGVDGIMIGRAVVGNPWIFRDIKHYLKTGETLAPPDLKERIAVCRRHLMDGIAWKGEIIALLETRRHYSHYFKGLPDFKQYRMKLMLAESTELVFNILDEIEQHYQLDHLN
jgi:tRNA-dihydrouridine synthase